MIARIVLILMSISMLSFFARAGELPKSVKKKVVFVDLSKTAKTRGPHQTRDSRRVMSAQASLEARLLARAQQPIPE